MVLPTTLQGRPFGAAELAQIRQLLALQPAPSRYQISRQLAQLWDWRTPTGQLKDMAARTLLLKLQARGWIQLPPCRRASPTRSGRAARRGAAWVVDTTPLRSSLAQLGPLQIEEVSGAGAGERGRAELELALAQYHYLGYRSRVGENLQYWVRTATGRPLAGVVFGAAAWQCAARDQWIGWTHAQRAARLSQLANNPRFLILPKVPSYYRTSSVLSCRSNSGCCWSIDGTDKPAWTLATAA